MKMMNSGNQTKQRRLEKVTTRWPDTMCGLYITLHQKTIYSGLSKSKDHYGDVVITQCLGKIAEINEFSASDEML